MRLNATIAEGKVRYSEVRDNFGFVCWTYELNDGGFYDSIIETTHDRKKRSNEARTYKFYKGKKTLISIEINTRNGSIEESYNVKGNIVYRILRNREGLIHNTGEPAYQEWYDNGLRKSEFYYTRNKLNNPTGPAVSKWKETGYLLRHKYYSHGNRIHRDILADRIERSF